MLAARRLIAPILVAVLASGLLLTSATVAAASSFADAPTVRFMYAASTSDDLGAHFYYVYVHTGNSLQYDQSNVYPDQWLLQREDISGDIDNDNAQGFYLDFFVPAVQYQAFQPGGALAYTWYQSDLAQYSVFCTTYDQCFGYAHDSIQQYLNKGGAWGSGGVQIAGTCGCTIVYTGMQWNNTTTLP